METVIIRHPAFGTLALHKCKYVETEQGKFVEGYFYNFDTPTGDGCLEELMNFPVSCIK